MRKTVIALALGTFALLPATAASAADRTAPKVPVPSQLSSRRSDLPSGSADREWAYGCHNGQAWAGIVWPDGHISGRPHNLWPCDGPDWWEFVNQ
jgi:hypothetical protein